MEQTFDSITDAKILDLNKFKNESIEYDGLLRFMNFDLHDNAAIVLRRTVDYDSITSSATKYTSDLTIELVLNRKRTILKSFQAGVSKFAVLNYIKQELPQKLKEVLNIDVTIKDSEANRKWKENFSFKESIDIFTNYSFSSVLERLIAYPFVTEEERRDLAQHVDV